MITLLSSKIEEEILNHFELEYDITEPTEDYECTFEFDGAKITVPYEFKHELVSYKNDEITASKDGFDFYTVDREYFQIRRCCHNPNKKTLQEEIDSILEHEQNKHEENIKSSEAIAAHNEYLDLNNR